MIEIYAPGTIVRDMEPVMEDHEYDVERCSDNDPAIVTVVEQFWDESRRIKRGRGFAVRFELETAEEIRFLRREVAYRYEFHRGGRHNPYGNEEAQSGPRKAAAELIRRCDAAIEEVTA